MQEALRVFSVLSAIALVTTAFAHHASNLDYDADLVGTVEGVIDDVFWSNPHIHVYLTVTDDDGASELWDMEGPNLTSLRRRGISREMFEIGGTIAVTGTLGRDGTKRIWAEQVVKADGTIVMATDR